MTSFGMKTQREGTQLMKMIELPLAIINTTRISLHKVKVIHEHNSRGSLCQGGVCQHTSYMIRVVC
ncbi:hypothetical protein HanIR_Chr04g0165281 [Helianthus annuus]|nr:hypothetical protein HanIR_Chr04g0165281 [Helianthus annuus]